MYRVLRAALLAAAVSAPGFAQQADPTARCVTPDSVVVRGARRTSATTAAALTGIARGDTLFGAGPIQRAIANLYGTGDYEDVRSDCEILADGRALIAFTVIERPVLASIAVTGPQAQSQRSVEDRVELLLRRPVDPALVRKAITRIDSLYKAAGYYLARIVPETTVVDSSSIGLVFRVTEGRRMAIAQLQVQGLRGVSADDVAGAMKVRPEGWWWFQKGEFDEEKYAADLGERIPALFAERGYIDFQLQRDTLIVDPQRAKASIVLGVNEGEQYRVGTFTISGNQHFTEEFLRRYYPFTDEGISLAQRARELLGGRKFDKDIFNQALWDTAGAQVK
jgi:outer membrane protein insertion porin family